MSFSLAIPYYFQLREQATVSTNSERAAAAGELVGPSGLVTSWVLAAPDNVPVSMDKTVSRLLGLFAARTWQYLQAQRCLGWPRLRRILRGLPVQVQRFELPANGPQVPDVDAAFTAAADRDQSGAVG